jgi:hypothetical protein
MAGRCACPLGQTRCGDACVDTLTSAMHCGACGTVCPAGQSCMAGRCACPPGQLSCGGRCTDTAVDIMNCGACGVTCSAGQSCVAGRCACPLGQSLCAGRCVDTSTDTMNCGACGSACAPGQACLAGRCALSCAFPRTLCGAGASMACVDTQSDRLNCGGCGRSCAAGQSCVTGACASAIGGPSFQVNALSAAGCAVVDHNPATGDDRGGIAVSSTRLFYSGDVATARFDLANLANITSIGRVEDGLVSNLRDGTVYALANGGLPISGSGGTVNGLVVIDGSTGALTPTRIAFSTPITLAYGSGVFSGYDRIVLWSGSRIFHIDLRTAGTGTVTVTDLGPFTLPMYSSCESWAIWGVAEFFGGNLYVAYVQSPTAIARTRVPDGMTTTVSTFMNLSDMCSFTVSTTNNRWYFHHEGGSQFGGTAETAGFCNASWTTDASTPSSVVFPSAESTVGGPGGAGTLGAGGGAVRFQTGDFVQETFSRATPFSRLDVSFQMSDSTSGCAVGQPLSWNVLVNGTIVGTYGFAGGTRVDPRTITSSYTFAPQPAGPVTIRYEATSTVCPGGLSWNWVAGGSATLR